MITSENKLELFCEVRISNLGIYIGDTPAFIHQVRNVRMSSGTVGYKEGRKLETS